MAWLFPVKYCLLNALCAPLRDASIGYTRPSIEVSDNGQLFWLDLSCCLGSIKGFVQAFIWYGHPEDDFDQLVRIQSDLKSMSTLVHEHAVRRNKRRSPATRLPCELVWMVTWLCIWNDPPQTASHWTSAYLGWISLLWVCGPWRRSIMSNPMIFAHEYAQLPMAFLWFHHLAQDQPLYYEISSRSAMPIPGIDLYGPAQFSVLTRLLNTADFRRCVSIIVEFRGPVIAHLWRLALLSPLPCLEYLRVVVADPSAEVALLHQWAFNRNEGDRFIIRAPRLLQAIFVDCWIAIASDLLQSLDVHFTSGTSYRPSIETFLSSLLLTNLASLRHLRMQSALDPLPFIPPIGIPTLFAPVLTSVDLADQMDSLAFLIEHLSWSTVSCPVFRVFLDNIPDNAYLEIPRAVALLRRAGFDWNTVVIDVWEIAGTQFEISFSLSHQDRIVFNSNGEPGSTLSTLTLISDGPDSWWVKIIQLTLDALSFVPFVNVRLQLDDSHFTPHDTMASGRPRFFSAQRCAKDAIDLILLYCVDLHVHIQRFSDVSIASPLLTLPTVVAPSTPTPSAMTALSPPVL